MKRRGFFKIVCAAALAVQVRLDLPTTVKKRLIGYNATLWWYNEWGQIDSDSINNIGKTFARKREEEMRKAFPQFQSGV